MQQPATKKVTISLPEELLYFADAKAQELETSRSAVISKMLAEQRAREQDALAREGYRFYAKESDEFAEASASAVWEALNDDRSSR